MLLLLWSMPYLKREKGVDFERSDQSGECWQDGLREMLRKYLSRTSTELYSRKRSSKLERNSGLADGCRHPGRHSGRREIGKGSVTVETHQVVTDLVALGVGLCDRRSIYT